MARLTLARHHDIDGAHQPRPHDLIGRRAAVEDGRAGHLLLVGTS